MSSVVLASRSKVDACSGVRVFVRKSLFPASTAERPVPDTSMHDTRIQSQQLTYSVATCRLIHLFGPVAALPLGRGPQTAKPPPGRLTTRNPSSPLTSQAS